MSGCVKAESFLEAVCWQVGSIGAPDVPLGDPSGPPRHEASELTFHIAQSRPVGQRLCMAHRCRTGKVIPSLTLVEIHAMIPASMQPSYKEFPRPIHERVGAVHIAVI